MFTSFISHLLYACAVAVVYRVPFTWKQEKHIWKVVHAGLMLLALLLSVLGLCAVFDFHRVFHISDMYSVHSWVGICTVVMFTLQVRIEGIELLNILEETVRKH